MEEGQTSKRRRVHSFEPNTVLRAIFSHKYVNHLLPALLKVGSKRSLDINEDYEIQKIVRFEVDMALVLSAERFGWSRALKLKLERDMGVENLHNAFTTNQPDSISRLLTYKYNGSCIMGEKVDDVTPLPLLTRPLIPIDISQNPNCETRFEKWKISKKEHWGQGTKRPVKGGEEDKLNCRLRALGMLLPGGNEMEVCELLSEVESYIICLELQVSILQSLVDM